MVWFQCEDCGDNLKKPKLPNHFRTCSASKVSLSLFFFCLVIFVILILGSGSADSCFKIESIRMFILFFSVNFVQLSCIDCGEIFGRQNVESHTQCVTEAVCFEPVSFFVVVFILFYFICLLVLDCLTVILSII